MPKKNIWKISYLTDLPYFLFLFVALVLLLSPGSGIVISGSKNITFPMVWLSILATLEIYLLVKTFIIEYKNKKRYPLKYWAIDYIDHSVDTRFEYGNGINTPGKTSIITTETTYDINTGRAGKIDIPDIKYRFIHYLKTVLLSLLSLSVIAAAGIWIQTFDFEVNLFLVLLPAGMFVHVFFFHSVFYMMDITKIRKRIKTEIETGEKTLIYLDFENWIGLVNSLKVPGGTENDSRMIRQRLIGL